MSAYERALLKQIHERALTLHWYYLTLALEWGDGTALSEEERRCFMGVMTGHADYFEVVNIFIEPDLGIKNRLTLTPSGILAITEGYEGFEH